jgi:hypothetical protein
MRSPIITASSGRQRRYSEKEIIRDGGSLVENLHFLMDGKAQRQVPSGPAEEIGSPAPLDFEEYLLGTRSERPCAPPSSALSTSSRSRCPSKRRSSSSRTQGRLGEHSAYAGGQGGER